MAEILTADAMPERRGRARKYPWDEWCDGQVRRLKRGKDYTCTTRSMSVQIRQHAGALGLSAQVILLGPTEEPDAVQFRMYEKPKPKS